MLRIASGVSIIAQTAMDAVGVMARQLLLDARADRAARKSSAPGSHPASPATAAARSASPQAVDKPVDADDDLALAEAARLHRIADLLARDVLGVGRDGVFEIEDQRVGGQACAPSPARGRSSRACRARNGAAGSCHGSPRKLASTRLQPSRPGIAGARPPRHRLPRRAARGNRRVQRPSPWPCAPAERRAGPAPRRRSRSHDIRRSARPSGRSG